MVTRSNDVSVLPGRGDGAFRPARTYPSAGTASLAGIPFAISLGDFDSDGDPDLVTGGAVSVAIMRNDGTGRFTATSSNPVGVVTACTKVGDVNSCRTPRSCSATATPRFVPAAPRCRTGRAANVLGSLRIEF